MIVIAPCEPGKTEKLIFSSRLYMICSPFLFVLRTPLR